MGIRFCTWPRFRARVRARAGPSPLQLLTQCPRGRRGHRPLYSAACILAGAGVRGEAGTGADSNRTLPLLAARRFRPWPCLDSAAAGPLRGGQRNRHALQPVRPSALPGRIPPPHPARTPARATPLMEAVRGPTTSLLARTQTIDHLLAAGADVTAQDIRGDTVLHVATHQG